MITLAISTFSLLAIHLTFQLFTIDAAAQDLPSTSEFATYNGSKYGIGMTIQYPENWNIEEDELGTWFRSPVNAAGNLRIEKLPNIAENRTLSEVVPLLQTREGYKEISIISSNLTTLDGNIANKTDFIFKLETPGLFTSEVHEYIMVQIAAVKDSNLYAAIYLSDPENFEIFLPIAEKMVSSLRIQ